MDLIHADGERRSGSLLMHLLTWPTPKNATELLQLALPYTVLMTIIRLPLFSFSFLAQLVVARTFCRMTIEWQQRDFGRMRWFSLWQIDFLSLRTSSPLCTSPRSNKLKLGPWIIIFSVSEPLWEFFTGRIYLSGQLPFWVRQLRRFYILKVLLILKHFD